VFLRGSSCGGFRRTGSNGILPLPIVQIVVGWSSQCFYPLEARGRAGHCGCGTCCYVPKDRSQSATILQKMRWTRYGQSSSTGIGGRICSDATDTEICTRGTRQLCRNGFADAGRAPQAKGFSQRVWRFRRSPVGIRTDSKGPGWCPLMAHSGHSGGRNQCPHSGVKRTRLPSASGHQEPSLCVPRLRQVALPSPACASEPSSVTRAPAPAGKTRAPTLLRSARYTAPPRGICDSS
jgi:hypothetical protein